MTINYVKRAFEKFKKQSGKGIGTNIGYRAIELFIEFLEEEELERK